MAPVQILCPLLRSVRCYIHMDAPFAKTSLQPGYDQALEFLVIFPNHSLMVI